MALVLHILSKIEMKLLSVVLYLQLLYKLTLTNWYRKVLVEKFKMIANLKDMKLIGTKL